MGYIIIHNNLFATYVIVYQMACGHISCQQRTAESTDVRGADDRTELPDGYFTLEPGTKGVYIKVEPGTIAQADTKYYKAAYSGITYDFEYAWLRFEEEKLVDYRVDKTLLPIKPSTDIGTAMMSFFGGGGSSTNSNMYNISSSALGLQQTPTSVHIYPTNFSYKDKVTSYLDKWN